MQRDNSALHLKVSVRREIARSLPPSARILELFCGEGLMFDRVWRRFPFGATIDRNEQKTARAAIARQTWAVYRGESEAALRGGWMGHVLWDLIDVDAYGSPWPYLLAWASSDRERTDRTHIILTDGYLLRASVPLRGCRALFDGKSPGNLTAVDYMREVESRLAQWGHRYGVEFTGLRSAKQGGMVTHVLLAEDRRGAVSRREDRPPTRVEARPTA